MPTTDATTPRPLKVPKGAKGPRPAALGREQALFAKIGPHEAWQQDDITQEQAAAQDKVDRLVAADAAVAELPGEVTEAEQTCPAPVNYALEVLVVNDAGAPIGGLEVELHRKGQAGILSTRTNRGGLARFEGLLSGDSHGVWIPSLPRAAWKAKGSEALPKGHDTVAYEAKWGGTSKKTGRPAEHTVAPGECMWTLSRTYGIDAQALWDANTTLAEGKRSAWVLAPGDVVTLPPLEDEPLESVAVAKRHTLECTLPEVTIHLRFQDIDGAARSKLPAVVRVVSHGGRETSWETTTDGDGCIKGPVPADAKTIDVVLQPPSDPSSGSGSDSSSGTEAGTEAGADPETHHFVMAHLDPIDTIAGVQGRLASLGYPCGPERGELDPLTMRALREFQKEHGLTETGTIDDATKAKLEALY